MYSNGFSALLCSPEGTKLVDLFCGDGWLLGSLPTPHRYHSWILTYYYYTSTEREEGLLEDALICSGVSVDLGLLRDLWFEKMLNQ